MQRRHFLATAATTTTALGASGFSGAVQSQELPDATVDGAVTLYMEFRVLPPFHAGAMTALSELAARTKEQTGFMGFSLKQMVGESTMTKNYPKQFKGLLAEAYLEGLKANSQPYFYALFVRFDDYAHLRRSQTDRLFDEMVRPHLHGTIPGTNGPAKSPKPMAMYRGVYQTVAAGNRTGIYNRPQEIQAFLRNPVDAPDKSMVTVVNHVMVAEQTHGPWESQVAALLKVAQETFQPLSEPSGIGLPGAPENAYYRKAQTTEILRNAFADGGMRAYLMHGVWDSAWDHENSHLDPRFNMAAGPVGAGVLAGPVEPFYLTRLLVS